MSFLFCFLRANFQKTESKKLPVWTLCIAVHHSSSDGSHLDTSKAQRQLVNVEDIIRLESVLRANEDSIAGIRGRRYVNEHTFLK